MTTDGGARGMNIREHIESGHYPLDDKGRALVPYVSGRTFVCCATDRPQCLPIVGWIKETGEIRSHSAESIDLLPPPPRKVKVSATLRGGGPHEGDEVLRSMRREDNDDVPPAGVRIELTGEYEEPWS